MNYNIQHCLNIQMKRSHDNDELDIIDGMCLLKKARLDLFLFSDPNEIYRVIDKCILYKYYNNITKILNVLNTYWDYSMIYKLYVFILQHTYSNPHIYNILYLANPNLTRVILERKSLYL